MANARLSIPAQIAKANQVKLLGETKRKMAGRDTNPEQYNQSRIDPSLFLEKDEVILHITGNKHQRAIFVERYNRLFTQLIIDATTASSETKFKFESRELDTMAASNEYKKMGFHYLSCCKPINDVSTFLKEIRKKSLLVNKIDLFINKELVKLFEFEEKDDCLSIFDTENAEPIGSAKNKYDLWLEQWHKPLTDDFKSVNDDKARRLLQLLQHYAGKDNAEKIFSFHWRRHHRTEIAAVIGQFLDNGVLKSPQLIADLSEHIAARQPDAPADSHQHNDEKMDFILLEESVADLNNALIEDILSVLKNEIQHSEKPIIKAHGDLFALFDVIKDLTGVDYFKLEDANQLRNTLNESI